MAIVPNKDGQGIKANGIVGIVDPSYDTPTLSGAAFPSVPSLYASQLYLNTTTGEVARALTTSGNVWAETNIR